ncbi:hypothetical protein [Sphingomonas sp.]|uniref:hypothetical protein n=1 Tax=Sphingomonas sp. TaxID=28214 RepID=UPI00286C608D|nr:hypothetical protein [Sphingomonas sp.]
MEGNVAKDKNKKRAGKRAKLAKAVQDAGQKAAKIATNPAVAEVVAASLVAAAAAIRDPKKARDLATIVGTELETASKQAIDRGNAFWQLALDIAKRSIDAIGGESRGKKAKSKGKTKAAGKTKAVSKAKPASKAKVATKVKAKAKAKPATKAKLASKAKTVTKAKPATRAKPRAKAKAPAKAKAKK